MMIDKRLVNFVTEAKKFVFLTVLLKVLALSANTVFIAKNPESVIVNIGAGFDNRFSRVDNGSIAWFDLDLPDSIEARKKVFAERERVTMISGSCLNDEWCEAVKAELGAVKKSQTFATESGSLRSTASTKR